MKVIEVDKCINCPFLLPPDIRDPALVDLRWGYKVLGRRWDDNENIDERERPHICFMFGPINELSLEDLNYLHESKQNFPKACPLPNKEID